MGSSTWIRALLLVGLVVPAGCARGEVRPREAAAPAMPAEGTEIEGRAIGARGDSMHGVGTLLLRRRMRDGTQEVEPVPLRPDGSFRTRPLDRDCLYDLLLSGIPDRMGARASGLEAGTRDVVLDPVDGLTLAGRLLDDEGEPPPPGTSVSLEARGAPPEEPGRRGQAATAADGSFSIEDLGPFAFSAAIRGGNFEGLTAKDAVFRAEGSPVEIRARFQYFLAGRLTAPGDTFEGCRVIVRKAGTAEELADLPVGRDGAFQGRNLPKWRLDLALRAWEREVPIARVDLPAPPGEFRVDVPDPPDSRRVGGDLLRAGTVKILAITGRDQRLRGATISLHAWPAAAGEGRPAESPAATGTTDGDGRYESPPLPAGWYELRLRAEGHQPGKWNLRTGSSSSVTVHAGISIRGVVVDSVSGEGVSGALVSMRRTGPGPEQGSGTAVSAEDGTFEVGFGPTGTYEVTVHGGGSRTTGTGPLPDDHMPARVEGVANGTVGLRIALQPGGAVGGVLLDGDGNPLPPEDLARMHLLLRDAEPAADERAIPPGGSPKSPGGEFRFGSLKPGRYALAVLVQGEGHSGTMEFGPFPAETGQTSLEVRVPFGATISGRVVDEDGRPFPSGAAVNVCAVGDPMMHPMSMRTAPDGTFRSARLDASRTYDAVATVPGRIPGTASGLRPGAKDVVLVPARGGSIRGVAVDEAGEPVPAGTGLYARPARRQDRFRNLEGARCNTGPGGAFLLEGLVPDAAYIVDVASRDVFLPAAGSLAVTPGEAEVVVAFRRGCALSGRILDAEGRPLGAWIDVKAEPIAKDGLPDRASFAAVTDGEGGFRLLCVPRGRLRITASKGGRTWDLGEIDAPAADVSLSPR